MRGWARAGLKRDVYRPVPLPFPIEIAIFPEAEGAKEAGGDGRGKMGSGKEL
jgi:hypothetical protein